MKISYKFLLGFLFVANFTSDTFAMKNYCCMPIKTSERLDPFLISVFQDLFRPFPEIKQNIKGLKRIVEEELKDYIENNNLYKHGSRSERDIFNLNYVFLYDGYIITKFFRKFADSVAVRVYLEVVDNPPKQEVECYSYLELLLIQYPGNVTLNLLHEKGLFFAKQLLEYLKDSE